MKKYLRYIGMAASLAGLAACGDGYLERIPEGQYVEETYYMSDDALDAATEPLYNRAWFDYNKRPAVAVGSLMANDAYNAYMSPEFVTFQVTALHANLSDTWKAFYSVITMANSIIDAVETKCGPDVTVEAKERTIGEARLMRGVAYFYMLRLWNNVILFEHNDEIVDNPVRPLNKPADAFRFIIEDMEYAASHLPESPVAGKASSWAAKGMLAKVYLCRSGWEKNGGDRDAADLEKARENALDVCRNSGIELLENYAELFMYSGNNNRESLLAMHWVENGQWGVCNTLLADIAFSPVVTGGVNVWGGGLNASPDMLNQYESGDTIRRDATFFTEGAYYDYICKDRGGYRYDGTAAPVKKGVIGGSEDNGGIHIESMNCPINTYILRLADVYLTLAEACLGNQESLSGGEGLEYFNKVRARAKMGPKQRITLRTHDTLFFAHLRILAKPAFLQVFRHGDAVIIRTTVTDSAVEILFQVLDDASLRKFPPGIHEGLLDNVFLRDVIIVLKEADVDFSAFCSLLRFVIYPLEGFLRDINVLLYRFGLFIGGPIGTFRAGFRRFVRSAIPFGIGHFLFPLFHLEDLGLQTFNCFSPLFGLLLDFLQQFCAVRVIAFKGSFGLRNQFSK